MNTRNQIHLLSRDPVRSPAGHDLAVQHLTDEQFTDLLLGSIPASVTAHLKACPQCAQEAQRVSVAIDSFQQQSRLWAERRTDARRTSPTLTPVHQPLLPWLNRPAAWSAAAAAIVLATVLGIGGIHRNEPSATSQPAPQQVASVKPAPQRAAPATIQSDNDLLSAINGELSADAAPPIGMYGLKVATHGSHTKSLKRMSN